MHKRGRLTPAVKPSKLRRMRHEASENASQAPSRRFAHIFFMDGVGVGEDDPETNPFVRARLPNLDSLLGDRWYLQGTDPIVTERATFVPTDATLGVPGRPQSATGQATLLTGRNVPRLVGRHYGPKPDAAVADAVREGTLFHDAVAGGGAAALITPYPQRYFEAIDSGKRLLSAVPLSASNAGLSLMTADDLRAGRAVSPNFTGQGWRDHLGYSEMPILTLPEAGRRIASIAGTYTFSFFEHWPSDRKGHRGPLDDAVQHLEVIDAVLGGLFASWNDDGLLIITSDHGNIEDKSQRQHTLNPVPTILMGRGHKDLAMKIRDLSDIANVIRTFLELGD